LPDPLERLTNLVALLLEARQPMTLSEIADALAGQYPNGETARRGAFERDKAALRDGGVPIETATLTGDHAGSTGYWIDRGRYELKLDLTADETRALQMAVAAVHLQPDWSADALLKLGGDEDADDDRRDPGTEPSLPAALLTSLPSLPVLFEATTRRSSVRFNYNDRDREVDPYGLLMREGFWYVVGFDHGRGEQRTFRVDRIHGAVEPGAAGAFVMPPDFDLAHALPDDPKAMGAPREALVEVGPLRAGKVAREVGDDAIVERRAGGAVVVRVPCANLDAFRSWVLGLLDDAVVIEPADVRTDVVSWLEAIRGRGLQRGDGVGRRDASTAAAGEDGGGDGAIGDAGGGAARRDASTDDVDAAGGRRDRSTDAPGRRRDASTGAAGARPDRDDTVAGDAVVGRDAVGATPRRGPRPAQERLRRLLVMLPWLMERGSVPLADVAERFAVSEPHLLHDLEVASLCGLPPYLDEMIDLWIEDGIVHMGVPRLFTRPLRLTGPEGFALLASARAAMALPGADPGGPLGRALTKLASALGVSGPPPLVVDVERPALLDTVKAAAEAGERLAIVYYSAGRGELGSRSIDPQVVFTIRGRWYVVADDSIAGPARTFRVDRIESATPTGERFAHRDVPIDAGDFFGEADTVPVTLRLPPSASWVPETYPVRDVAIETDGHYRVRLAVASERWLERLLLRTGPEAEVIEPTTWIDLGSRAAARLLERYR
jgi:predicted DNA-binding transcriptional regulator YafY